MQVVYVVDEGPHQRILWIDIVGNSFVSAAQLRKVIGSHSLTSSLTGEFNPKQVDEDVEKLTAYFRSFGFFHARIGRELDHHEKQNWVTITFVIDEGPRYSVRNVTFLGNRKLDNARLAKKCKHWQPSFSTQTSKSSICKSSATSMVPRAMSSPRSRPTIVFSASRTNSISFTRSTKATATVSGGINIETKGEDPHTPRSPKVANRLR